MPHLPVRHLPMRPGEGIIGNMEGRDLARLCTCPLFSGMDPVELAKSLARLPHDTKTYPAGSIMLLGGCRYDSLRILIEGSAKAEMTSDEGKTVLVESFRAVEAIATGILFSPKGVLPVTVSAKEMCRVVSLPRDAVLTLCMLHKPVLEALLSDMGMRMGFLAERHRAVQFATLRERLADWLLRRAELAGSDEVHLESSKERLAELFGVARPSLSRELIAMRDKKLISFEGRTIRILDRNKLRELRSR